MKNFSNKSFDSNAKIKRMSRSTMFTIIFALFLLIIGVMIGTTYSAFQNTAQSNGTLSFAINGHQGTLDLSNTKVANYNSTDLTLIFTLASDTGYNNPTITNISMGGSNLGKSGANFTSGSNVVATYSSSTLTIYRAEVTGNLVITGSSIAQTYTITYNANGGSGTMSNTTANYNSQTTLRANAFTRTGYTFWGWALSSTGDMKYGDEASVSNIGDTTLYAKWTANELIFDNQNKSVTFSSTAQNITFTGASNGTGNYSYSITAGNDDSYFSISGATITAVANAPVGSYNLAITATDSGSAKAKTVIIAITISKITLGTPIVSISNTGVVTWGAITGAVRYDISIDNSNWTQNVSSGYNYNSTITASTGSRTVYVRAIAGASYDGNKTGSKAVTVYSVTLSSGTGISSVSGAGRYISGASVTINAALNTGYHWVNWTGSSTQTSQSHTFTISSNVSFTANGAINTYTVSVSINVDEMGSFVDIAYEHFTYIFCKICSNYSDVTSHNGTNCANYNSSTLYEHGYDYEINFDAVVNYGEYLALYICVASDGYVRTGVSNVVGANYFMEGDDDDGVCVVYKQITSNCSISLRYDIDGN